MPSSVINSDDGVISGISGLKTTGGDDGVTTFQQNGTESMRIDSGGKVQIGTTAGALANERFNVTSPTNAITSLVSATNASQSNDIFRVNAARDTTNGSYNTFSVYNTGAAAYRFILTDGGNISTFGGQITFPATQAASTDANTLDDYEEGTWTPTLLGEGSAGTTTYTNQGGRYTKVGNMVTVWCDLSYSAATGTGALFVGSLPFATFNDSGNLRYPGACMVNNLNWSAGISYLQAFAQASSTNVNLLGASDDGGWVEQQVVNESARITFTLTYRVA